MAADQPQGDVALLDERSVRLGRRSALIEAGVNPYPEHCQVSDHVTDLVERYATLEDGADTADVVSVAGRVRAKRGQGKVIFIELQDRKSVV